MTSCRTRIQLVAAMGLVALLGAAPAATAAAGSSAGGRAPAVVLGNRSPAGPSGNGGASLGAEAGPDSLLAAPGPGADRLDGASPAPGPASALSGSTRSRRLADRRWAGITSAGQLRPRSPPGDRTS